MSHLSRNGAPDKFRRFRAAQRQRGMKWPEGFGRLTRAPPAIPARSAHRQDQALLRDAPEEREALGFIEEAADLAADAIAVHRHRRGWTNGVLWQTEACGHHSVPMRWGRPYSRSGMFAGDHLSACSVPALASCRRSLPVGAIWFMPSRAGNGSHFARGGPSGSLRFANCRLQAEKSRTQPDPSLVVGLAD